MTLNPGSFLPLCLTTVSSWSQISQLLRDMNRKAKCCWLC